MDLKGLMMFKKRYVLLQFINVIMYVADGLIMGNVIIIVDGGLGGWSVTNILVEEGIMGNLKEVDEEGTLIHFGEGDDSL